LWPLIRGTDKFTVTQQIISHYLYTWKIAMTK